MDPNSNIAWLAGIVDGEGCFTVKRPIKRKSGKRSGDSTSYQLWMVLCNTSKPMIDRVSMILSENGVQHQPIRRVWKGKKATRWQFWIHVARKRDLLRLTEILLPHLTAKRDEAEIVFWYLTRACQKTVYRTSAVEAAVLDSMAVIKRNGGEAPSEVKAMLREVIPSQAESGNHEPCGLDSEGVETRSVSPNKNPTHECPASQSLH